MVRCTANRVSLVLMFAALLVIACGADAESVPSTVSQSSGTRTATPAAAGTTQSIGPIRPTPTHPPPTPTTYSSSLVGTVRIDDPLGDPADRRGTGSAGQALPPGADLAAVEIDGDGTQLWVRWFTTGRPPSRIDAGLLYWRVDIFDAESDEHLYELAIRIAPQGMQIFSRDVVAGEMTNLRLASTFPGRIEAPYPAWALSHITGPFTWQATVEYMTPERVTWTDTVPSDGRASFP
jgi:hypothetical protein